MPERTFIIHPRRLGKQSVVESLVKRFGGFIAKPGGIFRWDGKRWRKVRKTRPL